MIKEKNIALTGKHNKPIVTDIYYNDTLNKKPVIIFCHGYKGFKDWGAWPMVANTFAKQGFFFVAFNFSHNGGTLENPIDFPDLEAFGQNNFIKELDDLETVIKWITENKSYNKIVDIENSKETIIKDKTGYLYKNKDPVDLANSIAVLMQKNYNSLKSLGIEGRKNVLKKFDVDKMCQTTFTEYKKLIELS